MKARKDAILEARKAKNWGVILGTLGRQGSVKVLDRVLEHMEEKGFDYTIVLMSEFLLKELSFLVIQLMHGYKLLAQGCQLIGAKHLRGLC
jgi:diphthamide biosynthesis enzyme Dph1/Dph2-like protein